MNTINSKLDALISSVKSYPGIQDVRFIREYGSETAEVPVAGAIAVVSVRSLSRLDRYAGGISPEGEADKAYRAEGELRLYMKRKNTGGASLRSLAFLLADALKDADRGGNVQNIRVGAHESAAGFDSVSRKVSFEAVFEEDEDES